MNARVWFNEREWTEKVKKGCFVGISGVNATKKWTQEMRVYGGLLFFVPEKTPKAFCKNERYGYIDYLYIIIIISLA
jgi:hypothetical protein